MRYAFLVGRHRIGRRHIRRFRRIADGTCSAPSFEVLSRILIALDDSPRAPRVAAAGALLAARFGATLHPMRALVSRGDAAREVPEHILHDATIALTDLTRSLVDAHVAAPRVRIGEPWRAIIELATEIGADLIVVGARGHSEDALGTTAGAVLSHASQNVFVVRDLVRRSMADT